MTSVPGTGAFLDTYVVNEGYVVDHNAKAGTTDPPFEEAKKRSTSILVRCSFSS